MEYLQYMEKADAQFLEDSRETRRKMEEDTGAMLGFLGRLVTVMESQAQK